MLDPFPQFGQSRRLTQADETALFGWSIEVDVLEFLGGDWYLFQRLGLFGSWSDNVWMQIGLYGVFFLIGLPLLPLSLEVLPTYK